MRNDNNQLDYELLGRMSHRFNSELDDTLSDTAQQQLTPDVMVALGKQLATFTDQLDTSLDSFAYIRVSQILYAHRYNRQ